MQRKLRSMLIKKVDVKRSSIASGLLTEEQFDEIVIRKNDAPKE